MAIVEEIATQGVPLAMFDGLNRFYAHADEPALLAGARDPRQRVRRLRPVRVAHQVDQAQQRAHSLEDALTHAQQERDQLDENVARACAAARDAQDQAAIAHKRIALLGDDLNAAQLRTARALAETDRVRTDLHALRATRTFRYTARLRNVYATLRRMFS